MPATRLGLATLSVRRYDVVGTDATTDFGFIGHVGLAREEKSALAEADDLALVHMMPPLERGPSRCRIDCLGTVSLTVDEIRRIDVFLDELEAEYEPARIRGDRRRQYVIAPHVRAVRAPDGTVICRRFSGGGLVIESYREADINLLLTDPASLPDVSLQALVRQYPDLEALLQNPKVREAYGIPGDSPWPVVLAGYVMNALDRAEAEIRRVPHAARSGDEFFPSHRAHSSVEVS